MKMTLYELTGQYAQLMEMAEEGIFDQKTINDTMEGLDAEIEEKAEGYAKVIRTIEGDVESLKNEISRLSDKKVVLENNIAALKKNLESAMIVTNKKKFKTALFSFGIQKNAPSLDMVDEGKVPEEFFIPQVPKLDRKSLLQYVKENGNQEFATMKQTESLRIR